MYRGKEKKLVLALLSKLYFKLNTISVGASGNFSCSTSTYFTSHHLLTTYSTNYYPKEFVNNFVLRRIFDFMYRL